MRVVLKLGLVAAVLGVLAAGYLPPLFAHGVLVGYARDAAQKGGAVVLNEGADAAQQLAGEAVASHPGIHLDNVSVQGNTVYVSVSETVHTLFGNFHVTATQGSSMGD